jgi:hypothetical protein
VQAVDPRVEAVVAYDKLASDTGGMGQSGFAPQGKQRPVAPALGVQSEYGFEVEPYWMEGSSSFTPQPHSPDQGPDPKREKATGFDAWQKAGVDSMVVVPRASTHLEYTDIPYVLPASRYGQDVTSWYTQAWFEKYLKHDPTADKRLLSTQFSYLEPTDSGKWKPVRLSREKYLSFYFCSAYAFRLAGGGVVSDPDIAHVGC